MSIDKSNSPFRNAFGEEIFHNKYSHEGCETWNKLSNVLIHEVMEGITSKSDIDEAEQAHKNMLFIAGGRYLYYAGRPHKFYNNCFVLLSEEDSREDWAYTSWKAETCLLTGGGIGNDYSVYRPKGSKLRKTGGFASGAVSKMRMINEIGREVMQGAGRRSAMYGSLDWNHGDIEELLECKNWFDMKVDGTDLTMGDLKVKDPEFKCPLDMTNISVNYDNSFLQSMLHKSLDDWRNNREIKDFYEVYDLPHTWIQNVYQALRTGEPGMSFNFLMHNGETGRNACTEFISPYDSDPCNLASVNMSRIENIDDFKKAVRLATIFLIGGSIKGETPYEKVRQAREKNRSIGLGLMGLHEWLLKRGYKYNVVPELHEWLAVYRDEARRTANEYCKKLGIAQSRTVQAIAPVGTIGLLAGTTTGIEPLFATAYKRRYIVAGNTWKCKYIVDGTARTLIEEHGIDPENIETAIDLAKDPERRIKFQADVQDYVIGGGISSTLNLPKWGTEWNNEEHIIPFAHLLAGYSHRLRGFTCYPDGARGNQPLESISYKDALKNEGREYVEEFTDICNITGKGGTCGA